MEGQDYKNPKYVIQILNKVPNPKLGLCDFNHEDTENFQAATFLHTNLELAQGKLK